MSTLLFFCGHAGAGKTTLAKRVLSAYLQRHQPYCFLDKDTLYGSYSASVMQVLTGNADDRDSEVYLKHLRNPEYFGLLETARENLSLGINTIVVGPLSQEVRAHQLIQTDWLNMPKGTIVKIIWVYLDEDEAHRRILLRADARDRYKLEHWDAYRTRLFKPSIDDYPELIFYNNTAPNEQQFENLLKQIDTSEKAI